jgi:hypothetical protein
MAGTDDRRDTVVAELRVPADVVELASGVDALYLSGHCVIPAGLWVYLSDLKTQAQATKCPVPATVGMCEFALADRGFGKYAVRLEHRCGSVGVTDSEKLPALRFQPRAEFLHGASPAAAVRWFRDTFGPVVGAFEVGVSRLDLFVDWQGWVPQADDRLRFVTRAKSRVVYEDVDDLTGLQFGKRGSGPTARLYDKTEDIDKKGTTYWHEVWGARWDPDTPVWRAEFEFSRKVLRDFRLDGPESVLSNAGGLWRYATHEWLTLRTPSGDKTASRWPIDQRWKAIQNATLADHSIGIARAQASKVQASLQWWLPRVRGALVACGALTGAEDMATVLASLPALLRDDEVRSGMSFEDRLAYRRWLASMS